MWLQCGCSFGAGSQVKSSVQSPRTQVHTKHMRYQHGKRVGSEHRRQAGRPHTCISFGGWNPSVHERQSTLGSTLVASSGRRQAGSCCRKSLSLGTRHFIFGARVRQRRRKQCRQIYICFSIYAKPLPLHHLSYQLLLATREHISKSSPACIPLESSTGQPPALPTM